MELDKIERLLERYDEGETSLAEENILREYFLNENVPEHLRSYQIMFRFSESQSNHKLSAPPRIKEDSKYKFAWTSIAAILIIALGMFFYNDSSTRLNKNDLGTISDEELALQKTKETLNMVSKFLNEGTAELVYLQEFNNTKDKIIQID